MFETIALAPLLILGVHRATQDDAPLAFVRRWLDRVGMRYTSNATTGYSDARWWYYPVLYCAPCMSSLWGTGTYFAMNHDRLGVWTLWELPVAVLAVYGAVWWLNNQAYE